MAEPGASPLPPTPSARSPLFRAEHFVWLTARVLEQRLFAHHFLHGRADPVETALDAYRNDDGGYGHALDPDLRGPVSQPLHAARALHVLDALGRCGGQRVERMCRYLSSVSGGDGAVAAVLPSQRGYPSTPSVPVRDDPPSDLLATGPVVGLLHRNEVWHAWLFRATDFCWRAVDSLDTSCPHEVRAAAAFLEAVPDRPRAQAAADRLGRLVRARGLAVLDPDDGPVDERADRRDASPGAAGHDRAERLFPYDYARTPASLARGWFTDDEMARSLDHLAAAQQEDGGWPVRGRGWAPGTALESRPGTTIEALRTLRAHGRAIG
ncbi:hypothetical protein ACFWNK_19460 [Streptomyces sp. NPDC058417]|uniref:hypothetical protein n=1 Tax=unclassified Streptomyces TaxID=2593676 RepID=UPI00364BB782